MSYETNDKMVSHPDHYKSGNFEVIDIIDEFTKDLSGTEAVCTANAIKYILRWKKKNGIQDVKKAIWYLQHMVDKEEERLQEEPTCSDCTFYEKGNCKFLNMHTMSDHDACGYLDPKTKEKEVDMDKIMNRPTEEKKFTNNAGEELNIPEFLEKPTDEDCASNIIKNYMNSQKVPTKPLKSMEEICEDIIAPKEPVKFEQPADEEIHSCDDCVFKEYGPYSNPCKKCDLSSNPPSEWMP